MTAVSISIAGNVLFTYNLFSLPRCFAPHMGTQGGGTNQSQWLECMNSSCRHSQACIVYMLFQGDSLRILKVSYVFCCRFCLQHHASRYPTNKHTSVPCCTDLIQLCQRSQHLLVKFHADNSYTDPNLLTGKILLLEIKQHNQSAVNKSRGILIARTHTIVMQQLQTYLDLRAHTSLFIHFISLQH